MAEAVALTGLTMVTLTLQPEQVDLINRPDNDYPRVFLHGPPEDCDRCADAVVDLMDELHVGGQKLQYRDTFILCQYPRQDMAMVKRLQARNKPVQVVTTSADDSAVIDVALATADVITVTDRSVVTGLERRIVIVMEDDQELS
nr:hypothetical protein BaRGS_004576 [Batillaria attramentaria]